MANAKRRTRAHGTAIVGVALGESIAFAVSFMTEEVTEEPWSPNHLRSSMIFVA